MKKPFVFGLIAVACVLFSLLLTAASGPPAILRNVYTTNAWFFTTNADANVTNVVSVVGTNADSSLDVTLAAFKTAASNTVFLAVSNAMAQTFKTNVSATVVNTIATNADGSITVRAQESTNRVTQGTAPWLTLGTNTIDGIADAVLAKLTNVSATVVNTNLNANPGTQWFSTNQWSRTNSGITYSAGQSVARTATATNLPVAFAVTTVPGGSGILEQIRFSTSTNTWTAINVMIYNSTNVTAQADGTAYTFYFTNAAARICQPITVPLMSGTDVAHGTVGHLGDLHIKYHCAAGDTNLYYNLSIPNGQVGSANQTNWIEFQGRYWPF